MEKVIKSLYENKQNINDYFDKLDDKISDHYGEIIWQYLRYNEEYRLYYDYYFNPKKVGLGDGNKDGDIGDESDFAFEAGKRWALSSLKNYEEIKLNTKDSSFYHFIAESVLDTFYEKQDYKLFSEKISKSVEKHKKYRLHLTDKEVANIQSRNIQVKYVDTSVASIPSTYVEPLAMIVNPHCSKTRILKAVEKSLDNYYKKFDNKIFGSVNSNSIKKLIDNITIHYLYTKKNISDGQELSSIACSLGMEINTKKGYLSKSDIERRVDTFKLYASKSPWIFF